MSEQIQPGTRVAVIKHDYYRGDTIRKLIGVGTLDKWTTGGRWRVKLEASTYLNPFCTIKQEDYSSFVLSTEQGLIDQFFGEREREQQEREAVRKAAEERAALPGMTEARKIIGIIVTLSNFVHTEDLEDALLEFPKIALLNHLESLQADAARLELRRRQERSQKK